MLFNYIQIGLSIYHSFSQSKVFSPVYVGLLAGLVFFIFPVIGFGFDYFPGDLGDGRLNLYFLEHAYKWFTGQTPSFWNAPFMYPEPLVTAYSDNLLGSAPFYSIFRILGFETYTSYQLWFLTVSVFNYLCAYYFLNYLFKNRYAAVIGAFVFAFSIALQSQMTHAQTFPRFAIPLAFLMAVKFAEDLKPKYFLYTILLVVYQIYCGIYLGFMLVIPMAIFLVTVVIKDFLIDRKVCFSFTWYFKVVSALIAGVLVLLPLMLPYMERKLEPTEHYYQEIVFSTIPTLLSHLFSHEGSVPWNFLSDIGKHYPAYPDHQLFSGAISTISLVIGFIWLGILVWRSKSRNAQLTTSFMLLLIGMITFALYLRFENSSAYRLIYQLPGFSSMRSITRIINVELIFFAIAVAFIFVRTTINVSRFTSFVFIVCLGLVVFDNSFNTEKVYRTEINKAKERTELLRPIFSKLAEQSVVSYEPREISVATIYAQIDAMLLSQENNLYCLNAYTATSPRDYGKYWDNPNEESRFYWLADRNFATDTLYIINSPTEISTISKSVLENSAIRKQKQRAKLEEMIEYIRTDKAWLEQIEKKAIEKNISLDSMLVLDAQWVIDHR